MIKLLKKLYKIERVFNPEDGSVYIERYMLWFTDRICINIMYGDIGHLHSHPWDFHTLILWGGYEETIYRKGCESTHKRLPGYLGTTTVEDFHKIQLIKSKAISLFIRSKKKTKFGFANFIVDGKVVSDVKYWKSKGIGISDLKKLEKQRFK